MDGLNWLVLGHLVGVRVEQLDTFEEAEITNRALPLSGTPLFAEIKIN